ncbi:hypothetical protein C8R44DRAFT_798872 [Mycena epipterygia]|nr:hypothetical protein C8R44DRAFT_798872 [Mycena epipterygia]
MKLGPIYAWISVDGVELSEFAAEISADGKEAICWIPSECDKKISVNWKHNDLPPHQTTHAEVTVDGISCGHKNMKRDRRLPRVAYDSRDSVSTSPHTRRSLVFAKQALTDDDNVLNAAISPELGSIKVEIRHAEPSGPTEEWRRGKPRYNTQVLHERSKKAMGHSVQFGAEFRTTNTQCSRGKIIKHLATFVFKYRPIEILRAQSIAPPVIREERVISAEDIVDLTMEDDVPDVSDADEIRKLEARLRELKNKGVKVKHESSGVKMEKGSVFKPGEVIDLT